MGQGAAALTVQRPVGLGIEIGQAVLAPKLPVGSFGRKPGFLPAARPRRCTDYPLSYSGASNKKTVGHRA